MAKKSSSKNTAETRSLSKIGQSREGIDKAKRSSMSGPNIEILRKKTLIKLIENSVGSRTFNSVLVRFKGKDEIKDVLKNGEYSCAFFVSSLLYLTKLIDEPHATVKSTEAFLLKSNDWKKIPLAEAKTGDVVVWEKLVFSDGSEHAHMGFVLGEKEAVSTDSEQKKVVRHYIGAGERTVSAVYRSID